MIRITIYKDKNNYIKRYSVSGHANYDEHGRDIVCAAVSVLTQTTLLSINRVAKIEEDQIFYSINQKSGYLDVEILDDVSSEEFKNAQIILMSLVVGLESVIDSYPDYVTLEYREV